MSQLVGTVSDFSQKLWSFTGDGLRVYIYLVLLGMYFECKRSSTFAL